jgi:hypothetical protein
MKYSYAIDANDKLVCIDEITDANRYDGYKCPECKDELRPVLGKIKEHHFRHKTDCCSWESYLHQIGKLKLKQRFDTEDKFLATYGVKYVCPTFTECKWKRCSPHDGLYTIDLKQNYDTCELEVAYKGFRADVMLSHSQYPEREPIFLEVAVTHRCESEKIESGIQIIEIDIETEDDANRKIEECVGVRFYNFKREIDPLEAYPLSRFVVWKDETGVYRGGCQQKNITCKTPHHASVLFDVTVPTEVTRVKRQYGLWAFGMALAILKGIKVKHCLFCYNHNKCPILVVDKTGRTIRIEVINSKLKIDDRYAQASKCKSYHPNRTPRGGFCQVVINSYKDILYQEWSRE